MNKFVKIVILAVAILVAVGLVMFYIKTKVSPPARLEFSNHYVNHVNKDIENIKFANTSWGFDSIYIKITHELDFFFSNSLLSSQERDELVSNFVKEYVPTYKLFCDSKFSDSVWNEKELMGMKTRVNEIKALKTTDGKIVIQGYDEISLDRISKVIRDYYDAKNIASSTKYNSINDAKEKIRKAENYANEQPINNCVELVKKLKDLPSKINSSHFEFLEKEVQKLSDDYPSWEDYREFERKVLNEIEKYEVNAKSVYGTNYKTDSIRTSAGINHNGQYNRFHPTYRFY